MSWLYFQYLSSSKLTEKRKKKEVDDLLKEHNKETELWHDAHAELGKKFDSQLARAEELRRLLEQKEQELKRAQEENDRLRCRLESQKTNVQLKEPLDVGTRAEATLARSEPLVEATSEGVFAC
eukprot:TRINITY_DN65637_c0_g1_i1.p1 TRINITY_DN65637_c0_g1~~TRINITY_DN65637_c0_g1_i1.p1  ORF type:complete len:124 (-),score=11.09 TRINITY_DN65637_c0_g1_i1:90-461(-)